jgi:outer membrane receptor protein involved in Fe transport
VTDGNPRTGAYDQPNALLSSQYQSDLTTNRVGTSWQVRQPGYTYTLGVDLQQTNLNAATQTGGALLDRHYLNVLPSLLIQPKLAPYHYLQVQYQNQIRAPSVGQLQPVANVTNPLFIQVGNPTLRPEQAHSISINYNSFHPTNYRTVYALLHLGLWEHRIVNSLTIAPTGVQTSQPINAKGSLLLTGSVGLGRPLTIGALKSTLNLTTNVTLIRGVSFVNDQTNRSIAIQASQALTLNATLGGSLEVGLSALATYQTATYSLQPTLANRSLSTLISSQLYYPLPLGFKVATDLTYRITTGRSAGYNQAYTLWNGYLSRSFLNQQQGELSVQIVDLLNQNRSLIRTVTDTYVEDGQSRVLGRYFLVSFIYNLRQFGSPK